MSIIPETAFSPQIQGWKQTLSQSIRSEQELLQFCELDVKPAVADSESDFPVRVTRYYASLIEKGNAQDPLLLQVLPSMAEQQRLAGYSLDAVGDLNAMPVSGLIHKYKSRALLTLTGACPVHCRYCFRRHFPYAEARLDTRLKGPVMAYLSQHTDINEVILSGGDPLMLSDEKLLSLIERLNQIPHIRFLRIHTRLLSVLPERITSSFVNMIGRFNGQVIFVSHINHPNEISAHNQLAFKRLSQQGFKLFNQSVLLKGVNNHAETLVNLSYRLFDHGIIPYYLHKLDAVHGSAHFELSSDQICQLYSEVRNSLPGYLVPKLVNEFSGQLAKIPVQCD